MKKLIVSLCFVIGLLTLAKADTWLLPTKEKYCSANKKYCLKVEPKKLESQLSYFQDKVDDKENAGADKKVKDNFCKGFFYGKGKKKWEIRLDNEVAPVDAIISDDGNFVITFDNWHRTGYGDNVVVIYNGSDGRLIKKLGLSDFLTESDIYNLPHSISSIKWSGDHQIDYQNKHLILKVVKPSKNDSEFFDVRIDLASGAILDKKVDRLPSLQFLLHTKESEENKSPHPVKPEFVSCQPQQDEFTGISAFELSERIISKQMPEYPPAARAVRAVGEWVFEIYVSENGEVECVKPISGHPLLIATLSNSMKKWNFEPSQNKYFGKVIIEGKYVLVLDGKVIE